MEFDWSDKAKEKYYKRAEKIIREMKEKELEVDRDRFGIRKGEIAMIYVKPFKENANKKLIKKLKKLKNFTFEPMYRKVEHGATYKKYLVTGYFAIEMKGASKKCTKG